MVEYLEDVPEPRLRCGIRHRVAVVLAFAVAAVLADADSVTAITEWAADTLAEVLAVLDAWQDGDRDHLLVIRPEAQGAAGSLDCLASGTGTKISPGS